MDSDFKDENGQDRLPVEILETQFAQFVELRRPAPRRRSLWRPLLLFALTIISTLSVGSEFAQSYARNEAPFSGDDNPLVEMLHPLEHPRLLLLGVPFSFTLLGILLAHEMGHYVACKLYGIDVSYPYFIPAPTLFGTFGAFIRIRSPIPTRNALFDVGIAGPIAGFVLAVPAMAYAIAHSKILPTASADASILFGNPPLMRLFMALFHPGVDVSWLLLHPIGRAAWVGLFATALNLLPMWQLDGGHIVYSLASRLHRRISFALAVGLLALGRLAWSGWYGWGGVLLLLTIWFPHPPLLNRWEPLGVSRRLWALVALAILTLCFTPWPAITP
jgi:membrane-associated protease RseP (regulator of RpoE activity)